MTSKTLVQQNPSHIKKNSHASTYDILSLGFGKHNPEALFESKDLLGLLTKNISEHPQGLAKDFLAISDPMNDFMIVKALIKAFI